MRSEINDILYNWLPLSYKRNFDEFTIRNIQEYIKIDIVNDIFWEKHYLVQLDEAETEKLLFFMREHSNIFLEKNNHLILNKWKNISNEKYLIPREKRIVKSLSWSKVWAWQKSKKQFAKTYFEWAPFFETKEIVFWSVLWNMIELWEYNDVDLIKDKVMTNFQWEIEIDARKEWMILKSIENIQDNHEFIDRLIEMSFDFWSEMEIRMQLFIDEVCLIGFADNWTEDWKTIKEFKTWKTPWTQKKVDEHWQLDFYCLMTYLEKWYLPNDVELTWFETVDDWEGWITVTWRIETFKFDVQKHKDRILAWEQKIPALFKEIQEYQLEWEKEQWNEAEVDENLFLQLYEVNKEMNKLKEQETELKQKIEDDMKAKDLTSFKKEWFWSIWFTTRKSWDYDDSVKLAKSNFDDIKKKFENENEPIEKSSIAFRFEK